MYIDRTLDSSNASATVERIIASTAELMWRCGTWGPDAALFATTLAQSLGITPQLPPEQDHWTTLRIDRAAAVFEDRSNGR